MASHDYYDEMDSWAREPRWRKTAPYWRKTARYGGSLVDYLTQLENSAPMWATERSDAMKRDAVKFFLPAHLVHNAKFCGSAIRPPGCRGGAKRVYLDVLLTTLGITAEELHLGAKYDEARGMEGLWIVCRPSQFARFVATRCQQGLENWMFPMQPEIVDDAGADTLSGAAQYVARETGTPEAEAKKVLRFLAAREKLNIATVGGTGPFLDVRARRTKAAGSI